MADTFSQNEHTHVAPIENIPVPWEPVCPSFSYYQPKGSPCPDFCHRWHTLLEKILFYADFPPDVRFIKVLAVSFILFVPIALWCFAVSIASLSIHFWWTFWFFPFSALMNSVAGVSSDVSFETLFFFLLDKYLRLAIAESHSYT